MLCLRARWVLPIDLPPIGSGQVEIDGAQISYCGPQRELAAGAEVKDLGDSVVLPGLVNVHTHLEYTMMRGFLEDVPFFPWIRALTAAKSLYSEADWLISARLGALECIAAGITCIGDNTDAGVAAQAASETGLRARVYQELFGIDHREPVQPIVAALDEKLQRLAAFASDRVELGVSPHATYTIRPDLYRAVQAYVQRNGLQTSIHLAESPAETGLIEQGAGSFAEMYRARGIEWETPGVSPTRYLYDLGALTAGTLCVHCVHQNPADIDLTRSSGASIAHCPKSNAKLGAGIAPLAAWLADEALAERTGIGTDSTVSNNTLDLFEEMRFALLLQRARAEDVTLTAEQMLKMATLGGAKALGWQDRIGSLTAGKRADITSVHLDTLHSTPATNPYDALVYSSRAEDVCLTMVDGRILYETGRFTRTDDIETRRQANELRRRLTA